MLSPTERNSRLLAGSYESVRSQGQCCAMDGGSVEGVLPMSKTIIAGRNSPKNSRLCREGKALKEREFLRSMRQYSSAY